jgi:TolB-like protein/class 3 adenylate cyclase/Flp pilus assembly protein TadD
LGASGQPSRKLAVILHADVSGSTELVQREELLAHARIQDTFQRFGATIGKYHGKVRELRGDALLGEFERASDAVTAALAFQTDQTRYLSGLDDCIQPRVRVGIAMGEVIVADGTITGTGVVLAQRIEQLTRPGGVGIQGAAYETIPGRFPFTYKNLGEHQVKGFENPVRLFEAELKEDTTLPAPSPPAKRPSRTELTVMAAAILLIGVALALYQPWHVVEAPAVGARPDPAKASIIVLPFSNLSGEANQAYFSRGITEDITTDLSRITGLFVIARNTAFTYEAMAVDTQQISKDLGVKYVLEGSVRRVGDRLRINVQLIDGATGGHLWANRYDGSTDDVLEFQDKVIESVVSTLSLKLDVNQESRLFSLETDNPKAYDAFLQGWSHFLNRTPEDYAEAIVHFKRAVALDRDYSRAYAALAATYWEGWERWWYKQLGFDEWIGPRREAEKYLAIAMQNPTAMAHQVASEVARQEDRHTDMVREAKAAVHLDPNDPNSYIGLTLALMLDGDAEGALEAVSRAMVLDPHYPAYYLYLKGMAYFSRKNYAKATEYLERALERNPKNFSANNFLIPAYAYLGRIEDAEERVAWHPVPLSLDWMKYYYRYKNEQDWEHFAEGLRLAGVPEVATKVFRPPED